MSTPTIHFPVTSPSVMFQDTDGSFCEIKTQYRSMTGAATNFVVVSAVTGKRIRLVSAIFRSAAASPSYVSFKDGSGGTALAVVAVPPNSAGANMVLELNTLGWFDSSSGVGIYADIGAETVQGSFRYIEYTQAV